MKPFLNKVLSVAFLTNLYSLQFVLALSELFWAFAFLFCPNALIQPILFAFSNDVWGLIFLIFSLVQFYTIYAGKVYPSFALATLMLRIYVVIGYYFISPYIQPALLTEMAIALCSGWVWVRSGYTPLGRRCTDFTDNTGRRKNRHAS